MAGKKADARIAAVCPYAFMIDGGTGVKRVKGRRYAHTGIARVSARDAAVAGYVNMGTGGQGVGNVAGRRCASISAVVLSVSHVLGRACVAMESGRTFARGASAKEPGDR